MLHLLNMRALPRFLHSIYRTWVRIMLSVGYDFKVWRQEELPPGPKIYVSNHFSSSDAHFVTTLMDEPIHMVVGPGFNIPIVRTFLKLCDQIPANTKEAKGKVVETAVGYLRQGDSIYIFPEGKLYRVDELGRFHMGAARMALATGCPIVPIGLVAPQRRVRKVDSALAGRKMTVVSKNYYANIGQAMYFPKEILLAKEDPKEAEEAVTAKVKAEVARLIEDIKTDKFWS